MRHQAQKGFCGIFVGIPEHQKGYLVYIPVTRKIISSYDVLVDESFSIELAYTSQPYSEAIAMRLYVMYKPCATYLRGKACNIITFAKFEEGNIWTKTRNDAESNDKSKDDSILPPLLSEEEIYVMAYGNDSNDDPIYTEMLENIRFGIQSHPDVNMREAR